MGEEAGGEPMTDARGAVESLFEYGIVEVAVNHRVSGVLIPTASPQIGLSIIHIMRRDQVRLEDDRMEGVLPLEGAMRRCVIPWDSVMWAKPAQPPRLRLIKGGMYYA
jgi:hypothetical protein